MKTIEYLEEKQFPYGVRTTITAQSVGRMVEIVDFFNSALPSVKRYHLEALFECGRCKTTQAQAPSSKNFIKNIIKAKERAKEFGKEVYCSGSGIEKVSNVFCGATGRNFFVAPSGDVTTCLEVSRENDDMASTFIVGRFDGKTKRFKLNYKKLKKLRKRTVQNTNGCEDCFAESNCAGDCLAKVMAQTGDMFNVTGNSRCDINRAVLLHEIKEKLKNQETLYIQ